MRPSFPEARNKNLRAAVALAGGFVFLVSGCHVVKTTADLSGKAVNTVTQSESKKQDVQLAEVQQGVLRLSDQLFTRMMLGVEALRHGTNALDEAEALKWKMALGSEITSMASGPNDVANLLDMTVFATVTRASVEDYWRPEVFGDSAQTLIDGCRNSEADLWQFLGSVLKPEQQVEFRKAIAEWQRQNPSPKSVLAGRAVGFASRIVEASRGGRTGSVFNLLPLDPFSGLDPATREIARTRLFAERALYVSQKMPLLLRWQTELLAANSVRMPEVLQLITNSTQVANAAEGFARTANQLPGLIDQQRETAIRQLFEGVASERTNLIANLAADDMKLQGTLAELRKTLDSGTDLVKASDTTIKSLDTFMVRFDKGTNAPSEPPGTNSRPFDILDYATTARDVTATLQQLNAAINSLDKATPQIQKAGKTLEETGNRLINRILVGGAALIILLGICLCAVVAIYRRPTKTNMNRL